MICRLLAVLVVSAFTIGSTCLAQDADDPAMTKARVMGITALQLMQTSLANRDMADFPGIRAWLAKEGEMLKALDKEKPDDSWRRLDGDTLITHSANFWQLFYEVVPGDPGLAMLHGGSLLAAGDASRAQIVLRLTLHRGDLDERATQVIVALLGEGGRFMEPSNHLVQEGVKLHDKADYAGALASYDAAMKLWPLNGWAMYEHGFTLRMRNTDLNGPEVVKAFAESRRMSPFQFPAWQGVVKDIPGLRNMHTVVQPLWEKSLKGIKYEMGLEDLKAMGEALQEAELDDLALVARQVLIVRQGRYLPVDHPFISKSLRRLVPGEQAEKTLKKLYGGEMTCVQLFSAPVASEKSKFQK